MKILHILSSGNYIRTTESIQLGRSVSAVEHYHIDNNSIGNIELLEGYERLCLAQLDYNQNALIMQLDSNAVYTGTIEYFVTSADDGKKMHQCVQG